MALDYDGATSGLFTRLGAMIQMLDTVRLHQANLKTILATIQGKYSAADAYMIAPLSASIEMRLAETSGILSDLRQSCEYTVIEMCYAEALTSASNAMRSKTIGDALVWLIRQMDLDSETVLGTTVAKSALSVGSGNNGNGKFLYLFTAPNILLNSVNEWPNIRTEMVEARCIQDAQEGALSRGSEVFEIRGQPSYGGLDYRFPAGSGASMKIKSASASVDNGERGQNLATNSDFEDQTSNLPDYWAAVTGAAGTEYSTETTNIFRGTKALKLNVTGSVFKIRQQLNSSAGSLARLAPDRPYAISLAIMKDAGATGTLRVSIQDAAGTVLDSGLFINSTSIATTTTSYAMYTATVRSPRVIPTDTYLVLETTVAIAVAAVYVDELVLVEMSPMASGGAALAIVAGSADWYADDNARYTFTNNNEGEFVRAFDRLFGMYERGLALPSNYVGGETISDALIV